MHGLISGFHWATGMHGVCVAAIACLLVTLVVLWSRTQEHEITRQRERLLREELQGYARLDESLGPGEDVKPLAKRVCRAVVEASAFRRVAMLIRDAEGKLAVSASAGLDDLTVIALKEWGARAVREERGLGKSGPVEKAEAARRSEMIFEIVLGREEQNDEAEYAKSSRRAIVTMLRAQSGPLCSWHWLWVQSS